MYGRLCRTVLIIAVLTTAFFAVDAFAIDPHFVERIDDIDRRFNELMERVEALERGGEVKVGDIDDLSRQIDILSIRITALERKR